jgi:SAM-dependent methyltransferase
MAVSAVMSTQALADWLGRRFPFAYRAARPPWRRLLALLGRAAYWESRRDFRYYRAVAELAHKHVPGGGAALDVGAKEVELLRELDWFERRVALDVHYVLPRRGVETVVADFLDFEPRDRFDLVLCLQVLEHLERPEPFARKLLATGRIAIVSVPYKWPEWVCDTHVQDPVDETKLRGWTGAEPIETSIVEDLGMERMIAVYGDGGLTD